MEAETDQPPDEAKRLAAGINDLLGVGASSSAELSDLFSDRVRNPEAQSRIQAAMKRGFPTRQAEMSLGRRAPVGIPTTSHEHGCS
jgi:hypothetical protein